MHLIERIEGSKAWYVTERAVGLVLDRLLLLLAVSVLAWIVKSLTGVDYLSRLQHATLWQPGSLGPVPFVVELALGFVYGLPVAIWMVLLAAYVVSSIAILGYTPGMGVAGLYVATENGGRASVGRVLLRHLLSYPSGLLLGVGHLWCILDAEGRTWHDIASGTRVIRVPPERHDRGRYTI